MGLAYQRQVFVVPLILRSKDDPFVRRIAWHRLPRVHRELARNGGRGPVHSVSQMRCADPQWWPLRQEDVYFVGPCHSCYFRPTSITRSAYTL